jgi:hypothetical protein
MAKELPYFKFEPAEYITKDVSFCSYAAQGLFINLCSHYWQRNCEMTLEQAKRRFKDDNLIKELLDEKIISHINGKLIIRFLIEQRDEAINKSRVNKENGSKGGRPKKPKNNPKNNPKETQKKPNGFNSLTETKGIREDKIKEDKINNIYDKFVDEVKEGLHTQAIDMMYMKLKIKKGSLTPLLKEFKGQLIIDEIKHKNTLELRKHFHNWLNTQERVGKLDQYKLKT